ncbi:hypothetical protein OSB04_024329 [Centaurea solstitialis]|uniref:Uncharacterized protein n=1 Tax=Centaurea solstitialis TaxID=347529 RepID=A0AA38W310_9ASTR|nr:hypothetical protein OSB04_024329 [Centaurea solstitialis]
MRHPKDLEKVGCVVWVHYRLDLAYRVDLELECAIGKGEPVVVLWWILEAEDAPYVGSGLIIIVSFLGRIDKDKRSLGSCWVGLASLPLGYAKRLFGRTVPDVLEFTIEFRSNLIQIPREEVDVKIGMDWWSQNQAIVDCAGQMIRIQGPSGG